MNVPYHTRKALHQNSTENTPPRNTMWRKRILRGYAPQIPVQKRTPLRQEHPALNERLNEVLNEALTDFSVTLGGIAFRFMPISMKEFLTITKN